MPNQQQQQIRRPPQLSVMQLSHISRSLVREDRRKIKQGEGSPRGRRKEEARRYREESCRNKRIAMKNPDQTGHSVDGESSPHPATSKLTQNTRSFGKEKKSSMERRIPLVGGPSTSKLNQNQPRGNKKETSQKELSRRRREAEGLRREKEIKKSRHLQRKRDTARIEKKKAAGDSKKIGEDPFKNAVIDVMEHQDCSYPANRQRLAIPIEILPSTGPPVKRPPARKTVCVQVVQDPLKTIELGPSQEEPIRAAPALSEPRHLLNQAEQDAPRFQHIGSEPINRQLLSAKAIPMQKLDLQFNVRSWSYNGRKRIAIIDSSPSSDEEDGPSAVAKLKKKVGTKMTIPLWNVEDESTSSDENDAMERTEDSAQWFDDSDSNLVIASGDEDEAMDAPTKEEWPSYTSLSRNSVEFVEPVNSKADRAEKRCRQESPEAYNEIPMKVSRHQTVAESAQKDKETIEATAQKMFEETAIVQASQDVLKKFTTQSASRDSASLPDAEKVWTLLPYPGAKERAPNNRIMEGNDIQMDAMDADIPFAAEPPAEDTPPRRISMGKAIGEIAWCDSEVRVVHKRTVTPLFFYTYAMYKKEFNKRFKSEQTSQFYCNGDWTVEQAVRRIIRMRFAAKEGKYILTVLNGELPKKNFLQLAVVDKANVQVEKFSKVSLDKMKKDKVEFVFYTFVRD